MGKLTVKIVLGVITLGLLAWDVYLAANPPTGDTISEVIRNFSHKHLLLPFALGVLVGHWFFTE